MLNGDPYIICLVNIHVCVREGLVAGIQGWEGCLGPGRVVCGTRSLAGVQMRVKNEGNVYMFHLLKKTYQSKAAKQVNLRRGGVLFLPTRELIHN